MKNKKRRGFTLVELLVVLLILGVLVGLAVPRYMEAQKNARFRTFSANVREIQSTLEVYRMDKTSTGPAEYPDNLSELQGYFTQQPVNPYTGKSMVTDNPTESGLQYTNNGGTYTLTVVQPDVDDINKNSNTTEPLPVALNVGGETETPTVTKDPEPDTEPPKIVAVTLTGTVGGVYGTYDITHWMIRTDQGWLAVRTVTVSVNDTTDMILNITATDNVGISGVKIRKPHGYWEDLIFDATSGTCQYILNSSERLAYCQPILEYSGSGTIWFIIRDVNGNTEWWALSLRCVRY